MAIAPADDHSIDIIYDPCVGIELRPALDTTEDELTAMDDAIRFWRAVANLKISRSPSQEKQVIDIRFEEAALLFRGVYQDEIGDVVVNRRLSDPVQRAITIAHELGHALGLPHIDNRESVMNSGNLRIFPMPADVEELGILWGPCVHNDTPPPPDALQHSEDLRTRTQP